MNQSYFTLGFLSGSSHSFVGIRGIYTEMRKECETSGFSKQGWLAAWTRDLTESRVLAAR